MNGTKLRYFSVIRGILTIKLCYTLINSEKLANFAAN